ncbi:uncharacterized protein LOC115704514 isoform X1 [Cannabis sativa]|uniref:uncharacterized protein LOC115704514 isoform X1 n=1 Tax=Cannabis sativa TaxID=3483 RepID=UPI0029CAAB28|nr:uncharacterized protein LOC115704514 isoform X1 [Cannabis sativa]
MAGNKKRKRREERPTIHPKNKYADNPPDFAFLGSLYPSFQSFIFYSRDGRPRLDWTDFNATRELTRVLLLHDLGLNWWIPDGQLCPTVPNRSNYIHWIEDLLLSDIIPKTILNGDNVRGFDIGTGANCIYPLLGASLKGWNFVGSDVTDVAVEWAERNVMNNSHISEYIEIRKVKSDDASLLVEDPQNDQSGGPESELGLTNPMIFEGVDTNKTYYGPPILLGVVKDDEKFDFCMCNPPFFDTMEEAGLNPKTSCGGTPQEMVCPGGEKAFICRIIEDSSILKQTFRWYTTMVGRKSNMKSLIAKLREVGVSIVKTTEFVQGQTCRWGIAWSFVPPVKKILSANVVKNGNLSFMLEGIQRQYSAIHVLQSIESFFCISGASCKLNVSSFTVDITASQNHCNAILKMEELQYDKTAGFEHVRDTSISSSCLNIPMKDLCFRISVFQQIPGTLLVKVSQKQGDSQVSGVFSLILQRLEEDLKRKFCKEKV